MQNLNKPWPCGLKNGMRNWVNFHYGAQKSGKLYIDGLFLSKGYVSARKFQRDYMSWHWREMKNDIRNLANFPASRQKSENLHFNWILLAKAYKDLDEKIQKILCFMTLKNVQSLMKNWLLKFGEFKCDQWQVWKLALWCAATFLKSI